MNFDEIIDRNDFPTMKWDRAFLADHFGHAEAIPMSVADMDLPAPAAVMAACQRRADHGIYGYEYRPEGYFSALEGWYARRHGWQMDRQQMEQCPSILNAVAVLLEQHSEPGDGVILQVPVFFEFRSVIKSSGRQVVKNPLRLVEGRYEMDFADLAAKAALAQNKILILCNPHNPVGRVWTAAELARVAEICAQHNVLVIADEIHGDFAFPPHAYTPYLPVAQGVVSGAAPNAVACISPAKSFNISGVVDALAIIPDDAHRQRFHDFAHRYQTNKTNVFASAAVEAAYTQGGPWLDALLAYLQDNVALIRSFLDANIPGVRLIEPEGTFLVWLDFTALGLDAKALQRFLGEEAQVALSQGYWFGREGAGFARMTIGCPRSTVQRALDQLAEAVARLSAV